MRIWHHSWHFTPDSFQSPLFSVPSSPTSRQTSKKDHILPPLALARGSNAHCSLSAPLTTIKAKVICPSSHSSHFWLAWVPAMPSSQKASLVNNNAQPPLPRWMHHVVSLKFRLILHGVLILPTWRKPQYTKTKKSNFHVFFWGKNLFKMFSRKV